MSPRPQDIKILIPLNVTSYGKKGLCRGDYPGGLSGAIMCIAKSTDKSGEGHMTIKAEMGVIWLQIKSCQVSHVARRGKE